MIDKKKYVVLDVETNGLSSQRDDLLSLALYLPDKDLKYERFFPLFLNKRLNRDACKINGITKEQIIDKKHMTQDEYDQLVIDFELNEREILHFGKIDKGFIKNYMRLHNIKGFSKLNFHNIKRHFITSSFSSGEYSKDNLCKGLNIEGVSKTHSAINDCLLEWKLFEKIDGGFVICLYENNFKIGMYKFSDDYFIPASKIHYFPNLKYAVNLPELNCSYKEVFRLDLSKECKNKLHPRLYQPAGFASEKLLWKLIKAKNVDDPSFAKENLSKLLRIGEFSIIPEDKIEVTINDNGSLSAIHEEDKEFVEAINKQMFVIKNEINPLVEFITNKIFKNKEILTQELIINKTLKTFGYCDFSNNYASMEMKFGDHFFDEFDHSIIETELDSHKYQYYITSNGRPAYVLIGAYSSFRIYKVSFICGKEAKKRIITWNTGKKPTPVEMYDSNGEYVKTFPSVKKAMDEIHCSKTQIVCNCNGKVKLTKSYQFKYNGSDKQIGRI